MSAPALTIAVTGPDEVDVEVQAVAARSATARAAPTNGTAEVFTVVGEPSRLVAWLDREKRRPTIVIARDLDAASAVALLRGGADGVLAEAQPQWLLRHAAGVASAGGVFCDPWIAHDVADLARPRRHNLHGVTGREQQVLVHAARGLDVRGIAGALALSPDTVKGHLRSLQQRLGTGRRELIRTARANGLLPVGTNRAESEHWDRSRGLEGVSVFVAGHERLARETLAGMLRAAGARVVGHGEGADAMAGVRGEWSVTLALSRRPDEDLHDLRSAQPAAALVVIPWLLDSQAVRGSLAARAQGVVGINARLEELLTAVRTAVSGGLFLDSPALRLALADIAEDGPSGGPLTPRQLAVLTLAGRGYTNRRIAHELGLAEPTVKGHIRGALRIFNARSREEAVDLARRAGLLAADDVTAEAERG